MSIATARPRDHYLTFAIILTHLCFHCTIPLRQQNVSKIISAQRLVRLSLYDEGENQNCIVRSNELHFFMQFLKVTSLTYMILCGQLFVFMRHISLMAIKWMFNYKIAYIYSTAVLPCKCGVLGTGNE
jgi:hypothetical protein